jgi:hypothetical protein
VTRIGLSPDALAADDPRPSVYAARVPGLNVLAGETLALVGSGTDRLLDRLAVALPWCAWVDGPVAAAGGALRVHAQQAARVGVRALAVTGPVDARLVGHALALAVADLAGLGDLGLTVAVEVAGVEMAALFADRVVVVRDGRPVVAYPVVQPTPRRPEDVRPVTERVAARLLASA